MLSDCKEADVYANNNRFLVKICCFFTYVYIEIPVISWRIKFYGKFFLFLTLNIYIYKLFVKILTNCAIIVNVRSGNSSGMFQTDPHQKFRIRNVRMSPAGFSQIWQRIHNVYPGFRIQIFSVPDPIANKLGTGEENKCFTF